MSWFCQHLVGQGNTTINDQVSVLADLVRESHERAPEALEVVIRGDDRREMLGKDIRIEHDGAVDRPRQTLTQCRLAAGARSYDQQ